MSSFYFNNLKWSKQRELESYKRRKSQLETIRNNISGDFEDNAWGLNQEFRNVRQCSRYGIRIGTGSFEGSGTVWTAAEYGCGDSNLSQAENNVISEINRVDEKIAELEQEISRLNVQISQARQREEAERKKALEASTS